MDDVAVATATKARDDARTYQSKPFHRAERERKQRELDRAFGKPERMTRRFEEEGRAELTKVRAQKGWMEGARVKQSRLEKEVANIVVGEQAAHGFIELTTLAHDVAGKARDARGGVDPVWDKIKKEIAFHQEQELLLADVGPPASWVEKPALNREYVITKRKGAAVGPMTATISEEVVEYGDLNMDPALVAAFDEIRSRFPHASHTELTKLFHHENGQRRTDEEPARQAAADVNLRASSLRGFAAELELFAGGRGGSTVLAAAAVWGVGLRLEPAPVSVNAMTGAGTVVDAGARGAEARGVELAHRLGQVNGGVGGGAMWSTREHGRVGTLARRKFLRETNSTTDTAKGVGSVRAAAVVVEDTRVSGTTRTSVAGANCARMASSGKMMNAGKTTMSRTRQGLTFGRFRRVVLLR